MCKILEVGRTWYTPGTEDVQDREETVPQVLVSSSPELLLSSSYMPILPEA